MSYADTILPEFDQEMASTRKVLERIPDDKLGWQAHPKSHTIGWNANHVADIPNWLVMVLSQPSLDIAPVGAEPYPFPKLTTTREIVELFDRNVASAQGDHRGQRRGHGQPLDAVAGRPDVLHHASLGGGQGHGPEPSDAPPRPHPRLPPPERRPGPRHVRAVGRRVSEGRDLGRRTFLGAIERGHDFRRANDYRPG